MPSPLKIAGIAASALAVACVGAAGWLYVAPPEMMRVASNYSAKIVCSNVFLAGRDAQQVLADDVQAPGHHLLRSMRVSVERHDDGSGIVRASLHGLFGRGIAVYRPGTGCASVPDGDVARALSYRFTPPMWPPAQDRAAWPAGQAAQPVRAVQELLEQGGLNGSGARAVLVVRDGQLVGQWYAQGFDVNTPLLGWSMSKTVTAAMVGTQAGIGRMRLEQSGYWPKDDKRAAIRLADLMAMSSGLRFNEEYGDVSDVTRMLFLEPDMAAFVRAQPAEHAPGAVWNYSSGTTVLLSRLWQDAADAPAFDVPHKLLFGPLGMRSAIIEADARGTLVGSSYMYASAQDWARFAQFLLQDGTWNGLRLLPDGFVGTMRAAAPASKGEYTQGQAWLHGPEGKMPPVPNPDRAFGLPEDTYWMLGHDGQAIAIVPSQKLVFVRLGLTPAKLNYQPQALLAEIIKTSKMP